VVGKREGVREIVEVVARTLLASVVKVGDQGADVGAAASEDWPLLYLRSL
jgi:hypothetical protein